MGASSAGWTRASPRSRRRRACARSTQGGASRRGRFWWPSCCSRPPRMSPFIACGSARSRRSRSFPQVRSTQTALQFGIFIALFLGLVVVLPFLTKRRTQCAFFCPFGAFQSIFSRTSIFDIRIDKEKCGAGCLLCQNNCPTLAIDQESIRAGKTLSSCMRCGACVDVCRKDAAVWHIKGTPVGVNAGARAAALSLRGVDLCHDVWRQHHRQLAPEADWPGNVGPNGVRPPVVPSEARNLALNPSPHNRAGFLATPGMTGQPPFEDVVLGRRTS